jgi:hypothetical protein
MLELAPKKDTPSGLGRLQDSQSYSNKQKKHYTGIRLAKEAVCRVAEAHC